MHPSSRAINETQRSCEAEPSEGYVLNCKHDEPRLTDSQKRVHVVRPLTMMVQAAGQTAQPGAQRKTLKRNESTKMLESASCAPRSAMTNIEAQRKHQTPQSVSRAAVDSKLLAVRIRVERSAGSEAERIEIKCIQTESIEAGNIAAQIIEAEKRRS
jgi:hypothetical protein